MQSATKYLNGHSDVTGGVVSGRAALVAPIERARRLLGTLMDPYPAYALGRGLSHHDMPVVRAIVRDSARRDFRFSTLVLGIVNSSPFQMRIKPAPQAESTQAAASVNDRIR